MTRLKIKLLEESLLLLQQHLLHLLLLLHKHLLILLLLSIHRIHHLPDQSSHLSLVLLRRRRNR